MPRRLALAILVTTSLTASTAASAAAPLCEYYYFKEPVALAIDLQRVAVLHPGAAPDVARRAVEAQSPVAAAEARPIRDWSLVALAQRAADAAAMSQVVSAAAASRDAAFVSPVFLDRLGGVMHVTPHVLVGFHDEVAADRAEAIMAQVLGGQIEQRRFGDMAGVYRVRAASKDGFEVLAAANELALRPEVAFAEPDMVFSGRSSLIPNDTGFSNCWGLHNTGQSGGTVDMDMDAPEAWDLSTGVASIIVVIIDNGVQSTHPDLNLYTPGTDTTSEGGDGNPVNACDNHGTPVAGCVSARINNSLGTVGVAPNCRSASARTFISNMPCDGTWSSQASWTVNTLTWAQSIGARVTNNSNYYGFTSSTIDTKYADTRNAGIVHFASAGNDASSTITYPASLPTVNAVAALNRNGNLAGFSNWGNGLAFSAPGQTIYSTDRTGSAGYAAGDYTNVDGTSFASPYSAGVAALVLSVQPSFTALQVENVIQQTCMDRGAAGYDTTYGWGFVNAFAALAMATNADIVAPTPNPMTFEVAPLAASTSSVYMRATLAIDGASPPVSYFFDFVSGGGSGGTDSGWQALRDYLDSDLIANTNYTYRVKARDNPSPNPPNETAYSANAAVGTAIQTPTGVTFSNVNDTSFTVTATGTFTNVGFIQTGFYFELTPPDGAGGNAWGAAASRTITGLNPCTTYTVRAKARNYQAVETPYTDPADQDTPGCVVCTLPGDVNDDGVLDSRDIAAYVRCKLGTPLPADNPACADFQTGTIEGDNLAFVAVLLQ